MQAKYSEPMTSISTLKRLKAPKMREDGVVHSNGGLGFHLSPTRQPRWFSNSRSFLRRSRNYVAQASRNDRLAEIGPLASVGGPSTPGDHRAI
jgi:hypothetical protein